MKKRNAKIEGCTKTGVELNLACKSYLPVSGLEAVGASEELNAYAEIRPRAEALSTYSPFNL